jgi:hypothetical protein
MQKYSLNDCLRGWICGKFANAMFDKDYEIAYKYYKKGDYEKKHKHMLSDEITIVLFGTVKMNGIEYHEKDIVVQEKGEATDFECISDMAITSAYRPDGSFPNDKYFVEEDIVNNWSEDIDFGPTEDINFGPTEDIDFGPSE